MSPERLNEAATEVLRRYPRPLVAGVPRPLGNGGGFSGARLWRLDGPAGSVALRAWPEGYPSQRLAFIHNCMSAARQAALGFVPRLFASVDRISWVEQAGRLWELQEWLPGAADYHRQPSPVKLRAACVSLARLHDGWRTVAPATSGPCPAVERRLRAAREWNERLRSGWRPLAHAAADDPARPAAERAWSVLPERIDAVPDLLRGWTDKRWPLQPCLCDVWHDHVLFDGDRVTGLIDYGATKIDHPAVDVARLLGSLVEDDADGWATGLAAYREVRPFTADEEALARALDRSGAVAGAAVWLGWLYHERKHFDDRAAAGRRLEALTTRIMRVNPSGEPGA